MENAALFREQLADLRSKLDREEAFHAQLVNAEGSEIALAVTYSLEDARRSLIDWGARPEDIHRIKTGYKAVHRSRDTFF